MSKSMRWPARIASGLIAFATLVAFGLAIMWWAAHHERGSAWLLDVLPGLQVEEPHGSLVGDFSAKRIVIPLNGGNGKEGDRIVLVDVQWRGLAIDRNTSPLWLRITIDSLKAQRIDVSIAPSGNPEPLRAPSSLYSPIELDVHALHVDEVHADALGDEPIRALEAKLHIGANGGSEHRIDGLALTWDRLQAKGSAQIASTAPMTLVASLALAQQAESSLPAWNASATLRGPLDAPVLAATLRASPSAERPAQALDARATLRPFAAWPLGDLRASTQSLDLSAFASFAPATALTGDAVATSTAVDKPASVAFDISNPMAGRWDEGRLPVRSMKLDVAGQPNQPNMLELRTLEAELGTPRANAGRLTANGRWSPDKWDIAATLVDMRPALLDSRAPAMQLNGPLTLTSDPLNPGSVNVTSDLAGQLTEPGIVRALRAVKLKIDAGLDARRIEVRDLQASAGETQASLTGLLSRPIEGAPWAVRLQAALVDFNPALWWPGRDDSPWRNAKTRLNGKATIDLVASPTAADRPLQEALALLRGQASITVDRSLLAGVPLSGQATLDAQGAQALVNAKFDVDGNTLQADGALATASSGEADHWNVAVEGPALARLSPALRLFMPSDADAMLSGSLNAKATVTGRWPQMSTQGSLDANALHVASVSVQKANATWTMGTSATSPVEARVTMSQLTIGNAVVVQTSAPDAASATSAAASAATRAGTTTNVHMTTTTVARPAPSIESLQLQLKGTARAHTLSLTADSRVRPPAWADTLQPGSVAADVNAHTVATLQAQGGIVDIAGAAFAGWRGKLEQLEVRSDAPNAVPLLRTHDLGIEAIWNGGNGANTATRIAVQPGRVELLAGAMHWNKLSWQAASSAGGYAQIETDAEIEPLRIAPVLARAQPDFGWGGDLTVGGHVRIHSGPAFSADIVVERASGDLTVTDELGTRPLGISELHVGLAVADGTWSFTQGLVGSAVGVMSGAVVVRTTPQANWPRADAPLQGVLELRVADLGTWGNWVPLGWRIGGALHTSASFAGRFGAPEYIGRVEGSQLSVRNFLQGVSVTDGDVAIALEGSSARIEHFDAKAGSGAIKIEGSATFGEAPKATLKLTATKAQVLGRVDRRIIASGGGQLELDSKRLAFDGKFNVDEGLIDFTRSDAPTLSGDIDVVRAPGAPSPAVAASAAASPTKVDAAPSIVPAVPTTTPTRDVALDLGVTLGEKIRVKGRGIDTGLRGELHVTSPNSKLAVEGTVSTADGTYAAYGQKLEIDKGLIVFSGDVSNPRLDIEATRPNIDVRVGVAISGTVANPRVRLFSEPELSEIDKLSWLVMGRASDGLGRTDTALLQRAALALLAGEGGGPTDQITKALGLDDISVHQTDGEVRETVIALGKQISRRWYVGYERGLNATTGSFQLIYRVAQRFTLRAQSGEDNSLDVIWTWRWH